jgi:kynurenine formamidase
MMPRRLYAVQVGVAEATRVEAVVTGKEPRQSSPDGEDEPVAALGADATPTSGNGNWGRWGDADERGAANLVGPEQVVRAASLVREGRTYPLGLEIRSGRSYGHRGRMPPMHFMTLDGGDYAAGLELPGGNQYADDYVLLATHGTTHVDALAHFWSEDLLYNGHPASHVRSYGATRCGIENLGCIVSRGVLLDVPGAHGLDHLEGGYTITPQDLKECLSAQRVELQPGDCVLVRTGWQQMLERDADAYHASAPGIGMAAAMLLAGEDVALVGSDTIVVEVQNVDGTYDQASKAPIVHRLLIRDHGIYLVELLQLEDLARDEVREFMFVLAPLRLAGGTASPVNAIAVA